MLDILAGTLGGIAGKIIEFPFDTVKVRMQAGGTGAWAAWWTLSDRHTLCQRQHQLHH